MIHANGRDVLPELDVSRIIGWFTRIYSVVLDVPDESLAKQIIDIKEQLRRFEKSRDKIFNPYPLFLNETSHSKIRINYMGNLTETDNRHWMLTNLGGDNDVAQQNLLSCDMDIILYIIQGNLHVTATFYPIWNKKGKKTLYCWFEQLEFIIAHCIEIKERIYTPSDFELVELSRDELDVLTNEL